MEAFVAADSFGPCLVVGRWAMTASWQTPLRCLSTDKQRWSWCPHAPSGAPRWWVRSNTRYKRSALKIWPLPPKMNQIYRSGIALSAIQRWSPSQHGLKEKFPDQTISVDLTPRPGSVLVSWSKWLPTVEGRLVRG